MLGNKQFELSNHLGNVLTTVSDRKIPHTSDNITIDYYTSDITSAQDYYAFGQLMPGRNWSSNSYKFGFNGKLNDDEVFGATSSFQDYGMRMYDTRACRFISVDPLTKDYPELTTYQFASNRPIQGIDLDGKEFDPVQFAVNIGEAKIKNPDGSDIQVVTQAVIDNIFQSPLGKVTQGIIGGLFSPANMVAYMEYGSNVKSPELKKEYENKAALEFVTTTTNLVFGYGISKAVSFGKGVFKSSNIPKIESSKPNFAYQDISYSKSAIGKYPAKTISFGGQNIGGQFSLSSFGNPQKTTLNFSREFKPIFTPNYNNSFDALQPAMNLQGAGAGKIGAGITFTGLNAVAEFQNYTKMLNDIKINNNKSKGFQYEFKKE